MRPPETGLSEGEALRSRVFEAHALGAQTTEGGISRQSEVATVDAQKPIAATLRDHDLEVIFLNAIGTANNLPLSYL